jgi:hypothetical protein
LIIAIGLFIFDKTVNIQTIISYITYAVELMPLVASLFVLKKASSVLLKVLFIYFLVYGVFIFIVVYFKLIAGDRTLQLLSQRIFLLIEFIFLSLFYYLDLKTRFRKPLFLIAIPLFAAFCIYDYITSPPASFSFRPLVAECLFVLFVVVLSFLEKVKIVTRPIYESFSFWFTFSMLINFSGNFFLFLFSTVYFQDPDFKSIYTTIYVSVTLLKNLFLLNCLLVAKKEEQSTANTKNDRNTDFDFKLPSHPQQSLQQQ